jgi:fucokinase
VDRREALRRRVVGVAVGMLLARDTPADAWLQRCPPLRSIVTESSGGGGGGGGGGGSGGNKAAAVDAAAARAMTLVRMGDAKAAAAAAAEGLPPTQQTLLAAARVALALGVSWDGSASAAAAAASAADGAARRLLRAAVTAPFASSPPIFGRPAAAAAAAAATAAGAGAGGAGVGSGGVAAAAAAAGVAAAAAGAATSMFTPPGGAGAMDFDGIPAAPTAAAVSRQGQMAAVRAEYPARLNLAGGWTDTPPYSLERQGAVLHVAVLTASVGVGTGTSGGGGDGGGDATANDSTNGRLRRAISATAVRLPGKPGVLRLVSEPGPGSPARAEELRTTEALLLHADPSHAFALHRACLALALVSAHAAAAPDSIPGKDKPPPPKLGAALEAFLGAPGVGLELRTQVDLPRGSGLGTSSVLALAALHALHELSTGCEWRPGGAVQVYP